MQEQVEEDENAVYAYGLDCEWDTEPCRSGEGCRKVGKVALMQILYTTDGSTKALLLRLPRKDKLPNRLASFLVDQKAHQGREIIAIGALENGAFCTVFSENFHKF
jgi:hypothetical protein